MSNDTNIQVFVDPQGRSIIGDVIEDTDTTLKVKNPAVIFIQQNQQQNQMHIQLIPVFFSELGNDDQRAEGTVWTYNKTFIATSDVQANDKLIAQYTAVIETQKKPNPLENPVQGQAPSECGVGAGGQDDGKVIKLFDDE